MVCIMHFTYTYTFPTAESAYFSQLSFDLPSQLKQKWTITEFYVWHGC